MLKRFYPNASLMMKNDKMHCAALIDDNLYDATGIRDDLFDFLLYRTDFFLRILAYDYLQFLLILVLD